MKNSVFNKYPVKFDVSEAACKLLRQKYKDLVITDRESYLTVVEGIREIRTLRVSVEKKRKELNRDALDYTRLVNSTARSITEQLIPTEAHLKSLKKAEDDRKLREHLEKERKEKERIDRIKDKLKDLSLPDPLSSDGQKFPFESSSQLRSRIVKLEAYEILPSDFEEFSEKAKALKVDTLAKLKALEQLKATQEAQARLEEKQRLEKEKKLAEQARLAEEERLAKEKALEEKAKRVEEEHLEQERILEEQRKAQEEQARLAEEKRLAKEKALAEQAKALEAEKQLQEAKARELEKKEKALAQAEQVSEGNTAESEEVKGHISKVPEVTEDQSEIKGISLTKDELEDIKYLDTFLDTLRDLILGTQQTLKSQGLQDLFSQFVVKSTDALVFLNSELNQWGKMIVK